MGVIDCDALLMGKVFCRKDIIERVESTRVPFHQFVCRAWPLEEWINIPSELVRRRLEENVTSRLEELV